MTPTRVDFSLRSLLIAVGATGFFMAFLWHLQPGSGNAGSPAPRVSSDALAGIGNGAWLTDLVVRPVSALPWPWPPETVFTVVAACVLGGLIAWLFERLIYNDWTPLEAFLFVCFLAASSVIVDSAAIDQGSIATMAACIVIIPGIRRIESVGDVQANMSFGLVLPILFLAGPHLAPLILPLALFGALADPTARHDLRAFIAMFLVAIMPTLLVFAGLFGILGGHESLRLITDVYIPAFTPQHLDVEASQALLTVGAYTILPFAIVTVFYVFVRDRRWQPVSALAVLALPLYLIAGTIGFSWSIPPSLPTAAFLGAYASWLAVARLRSVFRWVSIALMLLTSLISWSAPVLTDGLQVVFIP